MILGLILAVAVDVKFAVFALNWNEGMNFALAMNVTLIIVAVIFAVVFVTVDAVFVAVIADVVAAAVALTMQ